MSNNFFLTFLAFFKRTLSRDQAARRQTILDNAELKQLNEVNQVQIEQEVKLLKIKFSEQLIRVKQREAQTTQDYQEFLEMIDEMKSQIVEAYPDMPKVMALVIHQHAKQLIDEMWNNPDERTQNQYRARLTRFIKVVYDDTSQGLMTRQPRQTPDKTLKLIENRDE